MLEAPFARGKQHLAQVILVVRIGSRDRRSHVSGKDTDRLIGDDARARKVMVTRGTLCPFDQERLPLVQVNGIGNARKESAFRAGRCGVRDRRVIVIGNDQELALP